jgi:glucokinase
MSERYIGVDIGGTSAKLVHLEYPGNVLDHARVPSTHPSGDHLVAALHGAMVPWLEAGKGALGGVGVAVPGLVDRAVGRVLPGSNLPYLDGFGIVAALRSATDLPVELDNDANAAGLAEAQLGAAQGCDSAVCLTVGWGVGGALILGGRLWRGYHGMAGEVGRMLLDEGGERTLESKAGAAAIVSAFRALGGAIAEDTDVAEVARRADNGDQAAREALAECGRHLGIGLAIAVNFINPQRIVIGGGVANSGEWYLGAAREECGRRARGPAWEGTEVVVAALGRDAGAIGAALLCRHAEGEG